MFVVFEGIDGSGKTTISNRVAEGLRARGIGVTHLRAEGKFVSGVSEAIRELGRDARNLELEPKAEFLLYVARDVQLIEQALKPALARGDVVLADRFLFTAEVLGRHGRHLSREFVEPVLASAASGIVPDLVVLVDVDPTLARARRKAYKLEVVDERPPSRKGLSGVGLQHRVRQGYLELAAERPESWVVLENEEALDATVARVTELVADTRARGASAAIARFRDEHPIRAQTSAKLQTVDDALSAFLAWVDARLEREPRVAAYLLGGLFGAAVDDRRRALVARVPRAMLAAIASLNDEVSWQIREQCLAEYPQAVAATLGASMVDERSADLRQRLLSLAPREVLASWNRQDSARAWELRERFIGTYPEIVVEGLAGLGSERAWTIRERWLERTRAEHAARPELARIAARSVSGLDDDRAWQVRTEVRAHAPVAAIASLAGVSSPRSFAWRTEYVSRAPKAVMGTLRTLCAPEAWELRRRVADDCKEALDSIQDLDTVDAWEMREAHRDRWPSTVVKTLGVLSDAPRARALIERQLRAHPGNISLLKHVAAVALDTHHSSALSDD